MRPRHFRGLPEEALTVGVDSEAPSDRRKLSKQYRERLIHAGIVYVFLVGLSSTAFDMGVCIILAAYTLIPFCATATMMMILRPSNPTKIDMKILKWGSAGYFVLLNVINGIMLSW